MQNFHPIDFEPFYYIWTARSLLDGNAFEPADLRAELVPFALRKWPTTVMRLIDSPTRAIIAPQQVEISRRQKREEKIYFAVRWK